MVLPSCALGFCLLAAVAMILDRLTAIPVLVCVSRSHWIGRLTRTVDLGHHEPAEDNLVEGSLSAAWIIYCQRAMSPKPGMASVSVTGGLTGEELVEPHEELDIGILALRDLCKFWSIPHSSEIMLRPRGQLLASALLRRLDGGITYCGARLEHDAGQDRYPSCLLET